MKSAAPSPRVAVVIPCYRVAGRVAAVVRGIPEEIELIVVVDDGCPDGSGLALRELDDPRLLVLEHVENRGVGAAVVTGYLAALLAGAEIVVKMDGDGKMSPAWLDELLRPILAGQADYAKGSRFTHPETLAEMPARRQRRPVPRDQAGQRLLEPLRPDQRLHGGARRPPATHAPRTARRTLLLRDEHAR